MKLTPKKAAVLAVILAMIGVTSIAVAAPAKGGPMAGGFAFTEAVGFANPVDNPVPLLTQVGFDLNSSDEFESDWLDVRAYNSIAVLVDPQTGSGTFLSTDYISVYFEWAADPNGDVVTFEDSYQIFANGLVRLTDPVHGGWLRLGVGNPNSVPRNILVDWNVYGSYRSVPATWLRSSDDGILHESRTNVAAGATVSKTSTLGYGRGILRMKTGVAGGATVEVWFGGSSITATTLVAAGAGETVEKEFLLPRLAGEVRITNNAGVAQLIDVSIIQEGYPQ